MKRKERSPSRIARTGLFLVIACVETLTPIQGCNVNARSETNKRRESGEVGRSGSGRRSGRPELGKECKDPRLAE